MIILPPGNKLNGSSDRDNPLIRFAVEYQRVHIRSSQDECTAH